MRQPVAIIGAGPSGIVAAKFLRDQGFAPTIYESHSAPGGQWRTDNPNSGIWPGMVTNTFLEATRFSDLPYPDGTPIFPHNTQVLDYMTGYADRFGALQDARFNWKLVQLEQAGEGYRLSFETPDGPQVVSAPRVVVATGRYNLPWTPPIAGLERLNGRGGVVHSFDYKDPDAFRGQHVVVAGSSISALEIASDLAMLGAASVRLTQRRQRYVMPKMVRGVPLEYHVFTYAAAQRTLDGDPAENLRLNEARAKRLAGDPSRYGTPPPNPDFAKAGSAGSPHYLNLVAEGRVRPVPWIADIDGTRITFEGGERASCDALILCTGFRLNLPFLSEPIRRTLNVTPGGLEQHAFTLHPDLPGLAILGMWSQMGSYPTVLELQARYLSYVWGGVLEADAQAQRAGVAACVAEGYHRDYRSQNEMALRFARLCGADPAGQVPADLMALVAQSATTATLYRMVGPQPLPGAETQLRQMFDRFGPNLGAE